MEAPGGGAGLSAAGQQLARLSDRFYDRLRHPGAFAAARGEAGARDFDELRGHKYCLLVTFRGSGKAVPTPVWFGLDAEGRLYVRTEADAGKVKRIRANPRVRVAAATARGKPTSALAEGSARVLGPEENQCAEAALRANYGLGRRLYEATFGRTGVALVYLEITPRAPAVPAPTEADAQ